jgi:hypothetical protein
MPEIVVPISLMIGVILSGVLLGVLRLVRPEWASLSGRVTLVERGDLRYPLRFHRGAGGHLDPQGKLKRDDDARREEAVFAERSR